MSTESVILEVRATQQYVVALLTIYEAVAQLLDQVKKLSFYGKPVNTDNTETAIAQIEYGLKNLKSTHISDNVQPLKINSRIFHHILGILTESGELSEQLLDHFVADDIDHTNLAEEVGDLCWYQSGLLDAIGADYEDVLNRNIAKLRLRYPNKFTSADAINRNLAAERTLLEGGNDNVGNKD